uniref:C2H2-type domain-containing protein n=1 Tax=Periophthalmus magnuspinnatus TaxID=409849 RepID=A0A3B4AK47_9GOBI
APHGPLLRAPWLARKDRDVTQQREAVIRPQQAGKIDFSSLQHRTKFSSDRTWPSGKASPQSPSGKGRSREKGRRTGKSERGSPQQLYRLSITHPRPNPTIGIAYPQQKVSPPKKLEANRGPVTGSYRFHVPSLPEREAELQQDELSYSRCFQESSQGLTPQSYTSQPPAPPQPASMENNSAPAGSQLLLTDFPISGSNTWQSSDRTFSGANFGQKSTPLTDNNKSSAFVSGPFQYGYHMLEESASDAFSCEQSAPSQDFTDSLSTAHSEQGKAGMPECKDAVGQTDASGSKRNCHPKDTAANQRTLQGSVHYARSLPQGPGTQMHFPNKKMNGNPTINNMHRGSVNFDKNMNNKIVSRLPHNWEGSNKTYQSNDQGTQYNEMNDKFQFQNQSVHDQRSNTSKNSRMQWQQIRPNTSMHNQNVSLQISNQKVAYMVSPSDWQEDNKSHKPSSLKNSSTFQNGRQEPIKHGTSAVSTFKVEMSHTQVCESKNKTVYFGLNQPLTTTSSRNYSYPPLQVPPMGLMMVSPYESPLPSPVHNPASSSTCSSLSPASTSPVNFSSEESQMSKPAPPLPFYHPAQAKSTSDHLSSHPHTFHSDRALPYTADRNKDDMMGYLHNSVHTKSSMDVNKTYIDSFGVEHHQPPPPYSAHQLATSLATANLDQLDVLLTCKQCDQNFNNLASFLGHKQYCSQHAFAQNELKEISKIDDSKKFNTEPVKNISACSNISLPRCPSELHLSLLGLNKNGELIPDTKGENKDDSMKLNLFTGSGNLPVPLPELEMEDAKLDSLITEALNGMGYQSDNAEIDSSFIDAFGDDELNNVKTTSTKQSLKTKECEKKSKPKADSDRSFTQGKYFYDSDEESPDSEKQYTECKLEKISLNLEQDEKINIKKEVSHKNSRGASREKAREQDGKAKETRKLCKSEDKNTQRLVLSSKFSERCEVKGFQENGSGPSSQASLSPTSKPTVKESKRKNTAGGSWSKELIHKIVQQKNKLHKLHVKGTKNLQFSLVMERLTPTVQNPAFGEYDYVSDSDDECEPVKIASQGRLNQSSRCKYTYTKECKWRARSDRDQAAWRHESKECFEVKKSEELSLFPEKPKLKRRSSRSSTSSDLSTSVSDGTNSPKSTDRTDSDCEKKIDVKKKEPAEHRTYERSSPYKLCKESSKLALTFTKSVKKYNSDKAIVSEKKEAVESPKKCHSQVSDTPKAADTTKSAEKRKNSPSKTKDKLLSKDSQSSVDKNSQNETVNVCAAQEDQQQCNKPLHNDTQSLSIHKKADSSTERGSKKGGESGVTQSDLSTSGAFEKQNDSALKEPITLVNDLDTHKASPLCSSLMDSVCLSPSEPQDALIQKDTLHLMPYSLEPEQGLIKSPLSFDTSSMFGELAGFDSGIYSDMPMQKEAFHTIENTTTKKEEFVSTFSPFLEQRDWSMIVSPVLPDEISQYKAEKSGEKKADYNHVSLSLPEKIMDYSGNLNNCVSDDELEIKRIVNELENQLQTTKLESPPLLVQDSPKPLQMSKFSPLRLSDESENDSSSLDMSCPVEPINPPIANLPSEHYTESALPWSSPFPFELIGEHTSPPTPLRSEAVVLEPLTEKENNGLSLINTKEEKVERVVSAETKEDALEQRRYAENLRKSLEVISDSIFKEDAIITEHKEPSATSLMSQQHQEIECQTTDAFETQDQSEKEAITRQANILSPPNINERKDEIEFILNESHSSLSESNDPAVCGIEPISSEPDMPTENNSREEAGDKVLSKDCISENSDSIKPDDGPRDMTLDPRVVKEAQGSSRAEENEQLLKNTCVSSEHLSMRHEDAEAVKGIIGQCDDNPLTPALLDVSLHTDEKEESVTQILIAQSNTISAHIEMNNNEYSQCVAKDNFSNLGGDMSLELITTYKPCSPILAETNEENIDQCSPFPSAQTTETDNLLILSSSESLMDTDCSKVDPFNNPLQHDTQLQFDSIQKQEILNVQDIKEQLPVDFMASRQNSPCREIEDSPCLFMHVTQPSISLLTTSDQAHVTQCDNGEDAQASASNNQSVEMKSPLDKDDNHNELLAAAEIEYSKISPPHPDLGDIIECKVSKASIPSPLSITGPEVSEASESLEKTNPMYDLKLSPLNYSSISDDPPKLHQYDYIPISPVQQSDDNSDQREDIELNNNSTHIFKNKPDLTPELTSSHDPVPINETEQLTCFSLHVPSESISLASELKSHLEDCHNAAENIMTETEKANSNEVSTEDNTQNISDGPPTPKIICENEIQSLPESSDKQLLTIETGQGSTAHKQDMAKKVPNAQQGKVVCEICFMCFRTVPGLKRHKAMKHSIRAEKHAGIQNVLTSQPETLLIFDPIEKTHKDDSHTSLEAIIETIDMSKAVETGLEEMQNEKRRGQDQQAPRAMKVKDKQYKCKVCFSWFLTLGELNFHKLSHNPSPPPTCYMCVQRKFSSREQLRDHLWEKHAKNKSGIWTCGMCLKEISDVWMYNEHLREHATQFARRGQTQGSMLGISGIMQETAVKNFITSIMQHRPSKVSRESSKAQKEQDKNGASESVTEESKVHKVKSGSVSCGRPGILTPLEVLHKVDTPKNVEIHPNCKDPSRDCHHCGKQFPKPFKLQRHLVVHNLEKIFLCHKCPVSYQEAQELKEHLRREHEDADELDSKHTTLYTCELCADVMHVIKKSFICSTCNYTFSKKEQFDRHMEKHLLGGNKIFKFRGVLRPVKASITEDNECDSPASKKRRLLSDSLPENSSDSGIASVSPLHQNSETQPSKSCVSMADDSTQTTVNEYNDASNNVKTEDVAEDYSELLIELGKCIHMSSTDLPKEEIEPALSPNPDEEGNGKLISEACDVKEENESVCIRAASKESDGEVEIVNAKGDELSGNVTAEKEDIPLISNVKENVTNFKTHEPKVHQLTTNLSEQQREEEQRPQASKSSNGDTKKQTAGVRTEPDNNGSSKDRVKASDHSKSTSVTQPRVSNGLQNEDKEPPKLQKKRKDIKSSHSSQKISSPVTQENFDIEAQARKKFRPGKSMTIQRKSDGPNDYAVLSSMHGDIGSNKIISKCKTSNMQSKKSLLESCIPKKSEVVNSLNVDFKAKKGTMGRPLHSPISKVPMNNSFNKSKTKIGVRAMDSHSYRTAESQNHLLSQLFGQKLTSFKIPLRKDTSESIN